MINHRTNVHIDSSTALKDGRVATIRASKVVKAKSDAGVASSQQFWIRGSERFKVAEPIPIRRERESPEMSSEASMKNP